MHHVREGYVVRLENHYCSCGKWNKTGFPCEYAMAVIIFFGADPVNFLAKWFSKETYLLAYRFNVNPLRVKMYGQQLLMAPCYHHWLKECLADLRKKGGESHWKGRIQPDQNFLKQAEL